MVQRLGFVFTRGLAVFLLAAALWGSQPSAHGVVARFSTALGDINIRLYENAAPISVSNFLGYVDRGDYPSNTLVHRMDRTGSLIGLSIIQGGGYVITNAPSETVQYVSMVVTQAAIIDEVKLSNVRGTLSYAKAGPNTATTQWFLNLSNNVALDNTNTSVKGYTVFGRVLGNGMAVADAIAMTPIYNASSIYGGAFDFLPLRNLPPGSSFPAGSNFVYLTTSRLNYLDGDYNFDGQVNMADLCLAHAKMGSTNEAEADGNGNGIVDETDLNVWAAHADAPTVALIKGIKPRDFARAAGGTIQFSFTNAPGLCLSVFGATNLSQSISNWTRLGDVAEASSGNYQFIDLTATNLAQRFYRVSP